MKHYNVIYDGNVECRNAIRDMVVRGAPAIAIAAALSLAVEVENLRPFSGTGEEAVTFLQKRLDYLVSRSDPPSCHQKSATKPICVQNLLVTGWAYFFQNPNHYLFPGFQEHNFRDFVRQELPHMKTELEV